MNAQSETESEAEEEFSLSKRTPLRVLTVPKQQLPQNDLFDTVSTSSDSEDESLVFSQPKRSIQRKNADSLPKRMTEQSKSGEDGVNTSDEKQGKPQLEEQDCPQQKQPPRDQTNDETQQPRRSRRLNRIEVIRYFRKSARKYLLVKSRDKILINFKEFNFSAFLRQFKLDERRPPH